MDSGPPSLALSSTLNPNGLSHPPKSFIDAVINQRDSQPSIHVKSMSLHRGEPAVNFSKEEILAMAAPFKLSLVGKFSYGRPPMEEIRKFFVSLGLKGNSQISLLDNRHVLIKLNLEEDYSRVWLRQSWFINGRPMRMFKWSTKFRCTEESPIVPIWISLPYLPIHFVNCKLALYSIAAAVGKPLRVDQATASGNRPSVARVLIEYDISKELPRIWVGEGDEGFWQHIIFEKVPPYCSSCKHLGHDKQNCYIAKPELRAEIRSKHLAQQKGDIDKGKWIVTNTEEAARDVGALENNAIKYVVALDNNNTVAVVHGNEAPSAAADITASVDPVIGDKENASNTTTLPSQNAQSEDCMAVERVLGSTNHQDEIRSPTSARRLTGSAAILGKRIEEAELETFATADVGLPLPRTVLPNSFSPKEQQIDGSVPCTEPTPHVHTQLIIEPNSCLGQQQDDSAQVQHVEVEHIKPNSRHEAAIPSMGRNDLRNTQPTQEESPHPHFQPIAQPKLAQQSTAQEDDVRGLEPILGNLPKPQAQPTILQPTAQNDPKSNAKDGNAGNVGRPPITSQSPVNVPNAVSLQDPQPKADRLQQSPFAPVQNAEESHFTQSNNALSKEVAGPIGPNGSSSSGAPKSFSFQAGQHISFNPNPTVVVVDSLPMPKPIYISEDYITDGTVDESDFFYMPDYSHVSFNTHSSNIPDDTYYDPISRSHSLDDREFCDEEMGIDARCGVSDSAIDKRINTDADGFTKVTPRKSRQYHLRPRNRRR